MLLQIPTISGSIEVWDFLSVDSQVGHLVICSIFVLLLLFACYVIRTVNMLFLLQTYMFSDSLSIIQTFSGEHCLSVHAFKKYIFRSYVISYTDRNSLSYYILLGNFADKSCEKGTKGQNSIENMNNQSLSNSENSAAANKQYSQQKDMSYTLSDGSGLRKRNLEQNSVISSGKETKKSCENNSGSDSENKLQKKFSSSGNYNISKNVGTVRADVLHDASQVTEATDDSTIPTEVSP